ncbi:MAG: AAA family ATPase [Lachnospiraceae bacterium]
MGRFINPDNSTFQDVVNSKIYVDKTGLLDYTNSVIDTTDKFICNSRPRRFGKSITADMLASYYSKGCDSKELFSGLEISRKKDFETFLNQFDVIHFDVQWCMQAAGGAQKVVAFLTEQIEKELNIYYPLQQSVSSLPDALSCIHNIYGVKFIMIIDEWDVLIRDETTNPEIQDAYIDFLRGLFKGNEPSKYIHLAYLTGILPIKKIQTQSALNNFSEFTMLNPKGFAPYIGFTEEEVKQLCNTYHTDFASVKQWYDGYLLEEYQVYNPKAVIEVLNWNTFQSYWSQTGSYEAIVPLINMDFDGLKTAIIEMLSGSSVEVNVSSFQNDTVSFANRDDVLTYLIHLGYLGYDQKHHTAFVPNEEIRQELIAATKRRSWNEFLEFQLESQELLDATLDMDGDTVAEKIEKIHMEYTSVIQYNNENSLSSVLAIGYLSAMNYYYKPIREFPTGRGFADFVFLPKKEYSCEYPALLVELKWNKNAQTAMQQMKEKQYPQSIQDYTGTILLVGINYDKKTKEHQCLIEKFQK